MFSSLVGRESTYERISYIFAAMIATVILFVLSVVFAFLGLASVESRGLSASAFAQPLGFTVYGTTVFFFMIYIHVLRSRQAFKQEKAVAYRRRQQFFVKLASVLEPPGYRNQGPRAKNPMGFATKWQKKDEGPGLFGRIKDNVRTPPPLKPQIDEANRQIKLLITQLDNSVNRIRQRDATIFKGVVSSLAKHDMQHAAVYANELSEVRKVGKMVTQAQLALEQISLRLNTLTDMGEIANTLAPAVSVIKNMKEGLRIALPEVDREIGEISGLLSSVIVDAGTTTGLNLNFDAANEDAQKVLEEAGAVAEQRMKDSFPEIPADVLVPDTQEDLTA